MRAQTPAHKWLHVSTSIDTHTCTYMCTNHTYTLTYIGTYTRTHAQIATQAVLLAKPCHLQAFGWDYLQKIIIDVPVDVPGRVLMPRLCTQSLFQNSHIHVWSNWVLWRARRGMYMCMFNVYVMYMYIWRIRGFPSTQSWVSCHPSRYRPSTAVALNHLCSCL